MLGKPLKEEAAEISSQAGIIGPAQACQPWKGSSTKFQPRYNPLLTEGILQGKLCLSLCRVSPILGPLLIPPDPVNSWLWNHHTFLSLLASLLTLGLSRLQRGHSAGMGGGAASPLMPCQCSVFFCLAVPRNPALL